MKRKRKLAKVPGTGAAYASLSEDRCVFCFSLRYLYDRGAANLDYESEVEGLIAVLEATGYNGIVSMSQERLDAYLRQHAGRDGGGEDGRGMESIVVAAIERTWERVHV